LKKILLILINLSAGAVPQTQVGDAPKPSS